MAILNQDLNVGLDPTGYTQITGAQLAQLVDSANPASDKGFILVSSDQAGVPVIPDAATTTKWQRYLWLRISPLTTSISLLAWNPSQTYNLGYSDGSGTVVSTNWNPVTNANIPAGSIQGFMIATATITKDKILNIDLSQVNGSSALLTTSSTPTLADITDTSSFAVGFTIAPLAVTTGKLADGAVTNVKLGANAVTYDKIAGDGTLADLLRAKGDGTTEWFTPLAITTGLANPNAGGSDDGSVVAVDSGAAKTFKYVTTLSILQTGLFSSTVVTPLTTGAPVLNQAHGLGATPLRVRVILTCVTAELGYSIGDTVDISCISSNDPEQHPAFYAGANAANVYAGFRPTTLQLCNKGTGSGANITLANWSIRAYAWLN